MSDRTFVISFATLKDQFRFPDERSGESISLTVSDLKTLLKLFLRHIEVDEKWYLERHPDVAQSIASHKFKSATDHFVENGYFEGRLPHPIRIDEDWYLEHYPDVLDAVLHQHFESAQEHFDKFGYGEGRFPFDPCPRENDDG